MAEPDLVPGKKNEILRQAGIYSLGTQLTQIITLVAALLSRRFLGPTQTGIWATLQMIVDYSKYSTLGTLDAATREIPALRGRGASEEAEKIKNLAFSFIFSTSVIFSSAVCLTAFLTRGHFRPEITYGLYFVALVVFFQRMNNLLVALLRCYKKFELEAIFMIASALVNAALVALLTYHFKIYGFISALILSFVFNIAFLLTRYPYHFRFNFDKERLKPLIGYGLPLMTLGILAALLKSIDKIMVVKLMGFEQLGIYSIALMACSYLGNFAISVAIVLVPHFQEKFGRSGLPRDLEIYLIKASKAYALTLPVMIALAWFAAPLAIKWILPKFDLGIPAMKTLSLSLFFIALIQPFHDFLITIKKHGLLFPILLITCVAAVSANWFVIQRGWGLEGVALATVGVYALNFTLVFFTAAFHLSGIKPLVKHFLKIFAVAIYFMTALTLTQSDHLNTPSRPALSFLLGVGLFALAYTPLGFALNKEFSFWTVFKRRFLKKTR